ncbi:MAG: DinB family protein [Pyrinomonadaceae bacterium]
MIDVLPIIESRSHLIESVLNEFGHAIRLIKSLEDDLYAGTSEDRGSIGAHFRHNLDVGANFLKGLETGTIDYGNRERDERVERSRLYAVQRFERLICRMKALPNETLETMVLVRSEVDPCVCHTSSVARELEFLHSHTVHHHAMIAEKLRSLGVNVKADFGVAPSTLRFWAEQRTDFTAHTFQD